MAPPNASHTPSRYKHRDVSAGVRVPRERASDCRVTEVAMSEGVTIDQKGVRAETVSRKKSTVVRTASAWEKLAYGAALKWGPDYSASRSGYTSDSTWRRKYGTPLIDAASPEKEPIVRGCGRATG
ncbi:hypothetical protein FI667_g6556, partial [Globisporangium splendens]